MSVGKRRRRLYHFYLSLMILLWMFPGALLAAGGKPATKLINVADVRGLEEGLTKFVGDLYNTSYWLFGVATVVIMASMGLILGLGFDKLIGLLGLDLGKLDHHKE